jgi:Tfp pilus assembly protein PilF
VRESLRDFDAVVRRDPDNPLGYSGRADAYLALYDVLCESPSPQCGRIADRSYAEAARAVELDQRSAEAHTSLAMALHAFVRDDVRADAEFARAIALDPSYALAHHWYGNSLLERGAIDAATRQHETALALEPASPATYGWLAQDAFYGRRYRDVIGFAREALAIYPGRRTIRMLLGLAYDRTRDWAGASAAFGRLPRWQRAALAAEIFAREGKRDRAEALLRAMEREGAQTGYALDMAFAWIALGDRARARAALVRAHVTNPIELDLLRLDPRMDSVRGDPRFRAWTVRGETSAS